MILGVFMESDQITIFDLTLDKCKDLLESRKICITVVGIGRIGLPTALSIANSGLSTIGVDTNPNLIQMIAEKNFPLKDEPGYAEIFDEVIKKNLFTATSDLQSAVSNSHVLILSLPTPMNDQKIPDYSIILSVAKQLRDLDLTGKIIVVESTVEPGFIENEFVPTIESDKNHVGLDFGVGVCPETANPGEIMKDFTNLPRLVAGMNEQTTNILLELYHHIFPVELMRMPNCKTANAVKLTTNVFRDINIAFVSELSIMFEKLGIDTFKVLEAAKKKYNFQIHYPGSGVGGPCLPINSYQLLNSAKKTQSKLSIIESGRKINENMPYHAIELLSDGLKECGKSFQNCTILILGVSYKPNVKDIQLSPAEIIVTKLQNLGAKILIFDPYFISTEIYGIMTETNLENIFPTLDGVIIVTGHDAFKDIPISNFSKMKSPVLVDTRGIISPESVKKENIIFRGLGRGV